jgi:hypothetical protein
MNLTVFGSPAWKLRAVFDAGGIGLILIGMPGIEKRLACYPQFIRGSALSMSFDK